MTKTRILLLADINSEHTQKWASALANQNYDIGIYSFSVPKTNWYINHSITLLSSKKTTSKVVSILNKVLYISFLPHLIKTIKAFNPAILHAHYASSYGFLGALSHFKPFVISAWGTDIIKFPHINFITKSIIKYNLSKADSICVTSHTLEKHAHQLIDKTVHVIPFGVDLEVFSKNELHTHPVFTIGCVKSLEKIYNIDIIIKAFGILKDNNPTKKIILKIVGDGSQLEVLQHLVCDLKLTNEVQFLGKIKNLDIPVILNELDILANISEYESFGVSVIEAMACKTPVIISNAEGLIEVVKNSDNAIIINQNQPLELAEAFEKIMNDKLFAKTHVDSAYLRVCLEYNWTSNLKQMTAIYDAMLKSKTINLA